MASDRHVSQSSSRAVQGTQVTPSIYPFGQLWEREKRGSNKQRNNIYKGLENLNYRGVRKREGLGKGGTGKERVRS